MKAQMLAALFSLIVAPAIQAAQIDATSLYQLQSMAHVIGHTGNWTDTDGTPNTFTDVSDTVPDGANDSVVFNTWVTSMDDHATLTLDFGTDYVGNLAGYDLAIFTIGHTTLKISINGISQQISSSAIQIGGAAQGVFSSTGTLLDYNNVILLNLDPFMGAGAVLNEFTVDVLTAVENPSLYPAISAIGAFNTVAPPTVSEVPLPLPIILFGSGLSLLGLSGYRKKSAVS
jgi:hypothetical protein